MAQRILSKEQLEFIKKKREEILSELCAYLLDMEHVMSADDIVRAVYHDDNDIEFEEYVRMIAGDNSDMEIAQELAMELFNYFPRLSLKGKSFAESILFYELKKLEHEFQKFKNGTMTEEYGYTLRDD